MIAQRALRGQTEVSGEDQANPCAFDGGGNHRENLLAQRRKACSSGEPNPQPSNSTEQCSLLLIHRKYFLDQHLHNYMIQIHYRTYKTGKNEFKCLFYCPFVAQIDFWFRGMGPLPRAPVWPRLSGI